MMLDFLANPSFVGRYAVLNAETGEPIERVVWADPEAKRYATHKLRPRTFTDRPNADLRIRGKDGGFAVEEHEGAIEIVDCSVNPLKAELLALLDDPEVAAKIQAMTRGMP